MVHAPARRCQRELRRSIADEEGEACSDRARLAEGRDASTRRQDIRLQVSLGRPQALDYRGGEDQDMRRLEFGWFLPTAGDTTAYGVADAFVPQSLPLFDRIVSAAETAGFEYMLVPVQTACWEAWISSAMMVARSKSMRMLVAARPSYINPVLMAKMISTFDQLSGGRICINLIAGQSEAENAQEGVRWGKEERYEIMDEEVSILKALWTTRGPVHYDGKFYQLKGAQIRPQPLQKPHPRFYLGGGSRQAWEISAKHSDVHLFWGDTYERIRANMAEIRGMAARHGRDREIGFGMRLQIVCRPTEKEAWEFAHELVGHASEAQKAFVKQHFATSEANRRVRELASMGEVIERNLWTGITQVRPGAGIAVVGTPEQCADTLQDFIDLGCHSFCLSGYLHDEEAERFGKWVMPILRERNRERILAA
jgi:alkanesulfonate monooxygenase